MIRDYEVIILGSGISGSLLATVLARHGVRTAIIDREVHPRFSIGEATVPETTTHLLIMAELYDVPELKNLANFFDLRDGAGSSHGVKRGFSFCYHHPHQKHDVRETTQTATLSPPFGPDAHWFRQDTDQYVLTVAAHYGAEIFQATSVSKLELKEDHALLETDKGTFRGQLVIDGTGAFSPFAKQVQIRDTPTRLKTGSRGLFTHMVDVKSWDVVHSRAEHGLPYRMDQTTLHHIFDGGWMWVIPFDNHEQATNKLCSVGVMFDTYKSPQAKLPAEEEWKQFLSRYPSIGEQFDGARAVRKWIQSPRIQYSSSALWSGRYIALPHAGAFIDPLFSTGLNLTVHSVNLLGEILIDSFKLGQLQTNRLQTMEKALLHKVAVYDRLVATSFKAFKSFELWNAYYRIWEIGTYFNTLGAIKCLLNYKDTGDVAHLHERFNATYGSPLACGVDGYTNLFHGMSDLVDQVVAGELEESTGIERIYALLGAFEGMPSFITRREPEIRTIGTFTPARLFHMFLWGRTLAPKNVRHYYDFGLVPFAKEIFSGLSEIAARQLKRLTQPAWDMFFTDGSNHVDRNAPPKTQSEVRSLVLPMQRSPSREAAAQPLHEMLANGVAVNGRAAGMAMKEQPVAAPPMIEHSAPDSFAPAGAQADKFMGGLDGGGSVFPTTRSGN